MLITECFKLDKNMGGVFLRPRQLLATSNACFVSFLLVLLYFLSVIFFISYDFGADIISSILSHLT